jgi:hypothetical protein
MNRNIYVFLITSALALSIQGLCVFFKIAGDTSIAYWTTCGEIIIFNYVILLLLEKTSWRKLPVYIISGFLIGAIIGLLVLVSTGKVYLHEFPWMQLSHPNFGTFLVEVWCLFTGTFGMVFNMLFWVVKKFIVRDEFVSDKIL